jgi:hypothetical protein
MIIHHISEDQIFYLESIFAVLTETGWVIPDWLKLLKETI